MRVMTDNPAQVFPARARAALKRSNVGVSRAPHRQHAARFRGGEADLTARLTSSMSPVPRTSRRACSSIPRPTCPPSFVEANDGGDADDDAPRKRQRGRWRWRPADVATGTLLLTWEQQAEIHRLRAESEATPPKMIEFRLFFSDYENVAASPRRIARGTGAKTTEERDVTSYRRPTRN